MIEQKQLENMECFKHLGSMLNYGRYTCEIKSRFAMAKAAFNKKTPKHTQTVIDATQKESVIDQRQHRCKTLI